MAKKVLVVDDSQAETVNIRSILTDAGCATNGEGNFAKIAFWKTPVSKCASNPETGCVPYYRWVSDYIGVIGGR